MDYPVVSDLNVRDDLKNNSVEQNQQFQLENSLPFAIATINLNGDLNIGMMMRTATLFGARHMFVFGKRRYDRRSTVGAQNYIDLVMVHSELDNHEVPIDIFDKTMVEYGYQPVFIEQGGVSIDSLDFNTLRKPCFIFGNEGYGLSKEFIGDRQCVSIAQRGVMRSLNVSAAAAIVCHQFSQTFSERVA